METARPFNKVIIATGVWLAVSGILWRHSLAQLVNAVLVGLVSVALGLLALRPAPRFVFARYLVVPLGTWLFLSSWLLPTRTPLTVANHLVVASLLLGIGMLPILAEPPTHDSLPT